MSKNNHVNIFSGADMGNIFFQTLEKFGLLNKVGGITVDNASVNETFFDELAELMADQGIEFDRIFSRYRCLAHILNLGVQDTMKFVKVNLSDEEEENAENKVADQADNQEKNIVDKEEEGDLLDIYLEDEVVEGNELTDFIGKIRKICKKIKYSGVIAAELEDFCKAFKLTYVKPVLDCKTRWNSSLKMLEFVQKLSPAIKLLCDNNTKMKEFKLQDVEWKAVDLLVQYLQIFKEATDLLSAEKYPTLPMAVMAINIVIDSVEKTCFALDRKENRTPLDEILIVAFQTGRDKILKHYKLCHWFYSASLILDPRHKIKKFSKTEWGKRLEKQSFKCFEKIYKTYKNKSNDQPANFENIQHLPVKTRSLNFSTIFESDEEDEEDELQRYLHDKCAPEKTDVLRWWSEHEKIYPILAQMARDHLSIMATSVPVERLFSKAGLLDEPLRNALKEDIFRALLCINA